ncbi:MAG: winged helix-turn-helix domain-containing protein [Chloroflexota bacterium]
MSILTIDQRRRSVILDNREIQLTPQEYRLLDCLGRQLSEVVSKQELLAAMWGVDGQEDAPAQANPMAVDLVIFRLRKKLSDCANAPKYLETRRGFGYILHNAQLLFAHGKEITETDATGNDVLNRDTSNRVTLVTDTHDTNSGCANAPYATVDSLPRLIQRPMLTPFSEELLDGVEQWSALTQREWSIFMLLGQEDAAQLTNRGLAHQLIMAENTLKKHLQNIYRKLNVSNRAATAILSARVQLHLYSEQRFIKGAMTMESTGMDTTQQQENEAIVRQYYQAFAARDTSVAAPLLADDVVRIGIISDDEPPKITRGKEKLLARIQRVIDDNGEIQVGNVHVDGDKVTCFAAVSTDMGRRDGVAPIEEDVEFLLQDGKILSYKAVVTMESAAKLQAAA